MKKENISEIISATDEKYIEEAASPVKKKKTAVRITAIAASLAVLLIAGITVSRTDFIKHSEEQPSSGELPSGAISPETPRAEIATSPAIEIDPNPEIATSPAIEIATEGEMAMLPRWEDLSPAQKFPEVKSGPYTYSTTAQPIEDEYISELISDTSLAGTLGGFLKQYTQTGKIYSIRNISTDCAVAVKIGEESTYYVYVNSDYTPLTLGDFINDLDLKSTLVFGKAYKDTYEFTDTSSSHTRRTYEDFDDSIIWDMLLSDTKAARTERTEYENTLNGIDISISLPLLGYKNISFDITDDGYIVTNILATQKCFFIGTEKSAEFNEYLEKNVKYNETTDVYEYPPSTPGTGEVVSPGYNPDMPVTSPAFDPQRDNNSENSSSSIPAVPAPAPAPEPAPVPDSFIAVETTQIR